MVMTFACIGYWPTMRTKRPLRKGRPDVLTIKQTAEILEAPEFTLMRWDRSRKAIPSTGNAATADLLKLRKQIEMGEAA